MMRREERSRLATDFCLLLQYHLTFRPVIARLSPQRNTTQLFHLPIDTPIFVSQAADLAADG